MLRRKINDFKAINRQYKSMLDDATNISEEMARQFEFLREEIKKSVETQDKITENAELLTHKMDKINRLFQDDLKSKQGGYNPNPGPRNLESSGVQGVYMNSADGKKAQAN
eukprot:TRINITY_DN5636_c0_g2_i5.p1 TRINITY_DN5636_c0_g2~~TRINITY_DN5636_c0_g2_i5.p1  ORF type:complete len:111 (-),score=38.74 TRINITY_DN5636_c0_g2_i5:128-460(-)